MPVSLLATVALALAQSAATASPAVVDPQTLGPRVGEAMPAFVAVDQDGHAKSFQSLAGKNGLVFVFFRSADW